MIILYELVPKLYNTSLDSYPAKGSGVNPNCREVVEQRYLKQPPIRTGLVACNPGEMQSFLVNLLNKMPNVSIGIFECSLLVLIYLLDLKSLDKSLCKCIILGVSFSRHTDLNVVRSKTVYRCSSGPAGGKANWDFVRLVVEENQAGRPFRLDDLLLLNQLWLKRHLAASDAASVIQFFFEVPIFAGICHSCRERFMW